MFTKIKAIITLSKDHPQRGQAIAIVAY